MKYIIIVLALASAFLGYKIYNNTLKQNIEFDMGNLIITKKDGTKLDLGIKIADTINERARGLMNVKTLDENGGMLFVFEAEEMRKVWMESTYIPLDMLFINRDKVIFNYKENAQPLSQEIIYSIGPALYVLELNGGFVKKHNIQPGDKIDFQVKP